MTVVAESERGRGSNWECKWLHKASGPGLDPRYLRDVPRPQGVLQVDGDRHPIAGKHVTAIYADASSLEERWGEPWIAQGVLRDHRA